MKARCSFFTNLKEGDYLVCQKDFIQPIPKISQDGIVIFEKGEKYIIVYIHKEKTLNGWSFDLEDEDQSISWTLTFAQTIEHFYTISELRKIKLKKLKIFP